MDVLMDIFGTLLLLLIAISCRAQAIDEKLNKLPKWLYWFGNILAIA